jgi:hypothetical protein
MIKLSTLFRDPYLRSVFARAERDGGAVCALPHPVRPAPGSDAGALKRPEA